MTKFIICWYYDFLILIEDCLGFLETKVNDHRRNLDDKYWNKYLAPKGDKE